MNHLHYAGRAVRILTVLAALGAAIAVAPAAFASVPAPGLHPRYVPVAPSPHQTHAAAAVGMAGWQIALIAVGAAILAAAVAVCLDRARARHLERSRARHHELAGTPA
jgi:hypothetical protein